MSRRRHGRSAHRLARRCAHPDGCSTIVVRRQSQQCGAKSCGGPHGCGRFFCDEHLLVDPDPRVSLHFQCGRCFGVDLAADPSRNAAGIALQGQRRILGEVHDPHGR